MKLRANETNGIVEYNACNGGGVECTKAGMFNG